MYTFLSNIFFRICKMNTFEYYFELEIANTKTKQLIIFSSTSLAHFV